MMKINFIVVLMLLPSPLQGAAVDSSPPKPAAGGFLQVKENSDDSGSSDPQMTVKDQIRSSFAEVDHEDMEDFIQEATSFFQESMKTGDVSDELFGDAEGEIFEEGQKAQDLGPRTEDFLADQALTFAQTKSETSPEDGKLASQPQITPAAQASKNLRAAWESFLQVKKEHEGAFGGDDNADRAAAEMTRLEEQSRGFGEGVAFSEDDMEDESEEEREENSFVQTMRRYRDTTDEKELEAQENSEEAKMAAHFYAQAKMKNKRAKKAKEAKDAKEMTSVDSQEAFHAQLRRLDKMSVKEANAEMARMEALDTEDDSVDAHVLKDVGGEDVKQKPQVASDAEGSKADVSFMQMLSEENMSGEASFEADVAAEKSVHEMFAEVKEKRSKKALSEEQEEALFERLDQMSDEDAFKEAQRLELMSDEAEEIEESLRADGLSLEHMKAEEEAEVKAEKTDLDELAVAAKAMKEKQVNVATVEDKPAGTVAKSPDAPPKPSEQNVEFMQLEMATNSEFEKLAAKLEAKKGTESEDAAYAQMERLDKMSDKEAEEEMARMEAAEDDESVDGHVLRDLTNEVQQQKAEEKSEELVSNEATDAGMGKAEGFEADRAPTVSASETEESLHKSKPSVEETKNAPTLEELAQQTALTPDSEVAKAPEVTSLPAPDVVGRASGSVSKDDPASMNNIEALSLIEMSNTNFADKSDTASLEKMESKIDSMSDAELDKLDDKDFSNLFDGAGFRDEVSL